MTTTSFPLRLALAGILGLVSVATAAPHPVGAQACQECHKAEFEVWEKTRHALSFRELHKAPNAAAILAAVGGDKNPRKNTVCTQCHYTLEQADESAPAVAKTSVSCESCHGAASGFLKVHNDYGGTGVTRESEPAAHKSERISKSVALGMTRPDSPPDLAANCLNCHSLARPSLDGATISKMLAAGHPINPDYELVKYSQGTVRHRFYPPNVAVNAPMTPAELARWFVTGRAAMLVTATAALKKSDDAGYQAALKKQITAATAALNAVKSVPEAAALVAAPTEANARKLATAIAGRDLSAEVKALLPAPADYK
ncbi:MAG: cytochrome c family protein [Verrucomicrobia bacterium]|nr:cytochrome c family protein [Verrucomicrobiota bacterium]